MFETLPFSVRQTFRVLTPGFCHPEPDSGSRCFSLRSFSVLFLPFSFLPSLLFLLYFSSSSLSSPFFSFSPLRPFSSFPFLILFTLSSLLPYSFALLSVLFLSFFSVLVSLSPFFLVLFSPHSPSPSSFFLPFSYPLHSLSFPLLTPYSFYSSSFSSFSLFSFSFFLFPSLFSLLPPFLLFSPELALSTRSRDDRLGVRRLPAG